MYIYIYNRIVIAVDINFPDSKVHGANMGSIWGRQDPGGPHVGPMNFVIWVITPQTARFMLLAI